MNSSGRLYHSFMVSETWDRRIARATTLAETDDTAGPLLREYVLLLQVQRQCAEVLGAYSDRLTGELHTDLSHVHAAANAAVEHVATAGPVVQREHAQHVIDDRRAFDALLLDGWKATRDVPFLARVILQPYAECLARLGRRPAGRDVTGQSISCPFCGAVPQLSILRAAVDSDGGTRQLMCSLCATVWSFNRVRCPHCGQHDERQLGYFHTATFDHLRIDSCDACRHYMKTIDLTRLGHAVPSVDEVASAPLDLWATAHGYQKTVLNLIGL
jgi:formate dehydrogenase accessory protein FdhE